MFVVTGGGSGIGKALAHALAMRGKSVLIIGRHQSTLKESANASSLIDYICADVSTPQGRQLITDRLEAVSAIDALVHNAGIIEPILPLAQIDEAAWRQVMATNVDAPLFLTRQLLDKLSDARVLNIGSGAAYFPVKGWAAYCVSKAALSMLTQCWQLECSSPSFASVMPGIIDTAMQEKIRDTTLMDPEKLEFFKSLKQQGQLLSTDTVAAFLCWLLVDIDKVRYQSKEWDIYDKTHHADWLVSPHTVPAWE